MRTIAVLLSGILLTGCATLPIKTTEWHQVDGAWIEKVTEPPMPWWAPVSWFWCGGEKWGGPCPPGGRPAWSKVFNAVMEAGQHLDLYNMPTPK